MSELEQALAEAIAAGAVAGAAEAHRDAAAGVQHEPVDVGEPLLTRREASELARVSIDLHRLFADLGQVGPIPAELAELVAEFERRPALPRFPGRQRRRAGR